MASPEHAPWRAHARTKTDAGRACFRELDAPGLVVCLRGPTASRDTAVLRVDAAHPPAQPLADPPPEYTPCVTHALRGGHVTLYERHPSRCGAWVEQAREACRRSGRADCDAAVRASERGPA